MSYWWTKIIMAALVVTVIYLADTCEPAKLTVDLQSAHNGQLFYTQIKVGRAGSEQSFNMLVATSYHVTWIPATDISPLRGYRNESSEQYDATREYLWPSVSMQLSYYFYVHYNHIQLGEQVVERQPFALAHRAGYHRPLRWGLDGILALNDGTNMIQNADYLFVNLYKQNYIDHLMFSLYINNTAVANRLSNGTEVDGQQQPEGALVLGGVDNKYYSGDFHYVDMQEDSIFESYSNWAMWISDIQLDWSRVSETDRLNDSISRLGTIDLHTEPMRLKLDSSLILFVGHKKSLDTIHTGIIGAHAIVRDAFYVFNDCRLDNKPDIVFKLGGGFDVRMTPEDYMIRQEMRDRMMCLSVFKPVRDKVWLFGTDFMRKYYIVFDYESHRVGFAKPN